MINSLNPILNLGIARCDKLQVHHLRMVNLLAGLCAGGTLLFSALFAFAFGNETSALLNGLYAFLYFITFMLTREGMLRLAKYWVFIVFFLQQFTLPLFVLSDNFETELLLLVVPTAVVLVFDPSDRLPRYGLSLIAIILLFLAKTVPSTDPILSMTDADARAAYLCVILVLVMASVALTDFYLIDLHKIDESSRKLVHEDLLTETANSQNIYKQADDIFFREQRKKNALSVIALNIDGFRQINEMHGRTTGDQVLIHIATLLRENLSKTAILGRMHADTFIVLLGNTSSSEALHTAEQLKTAISRSVVLLDNTAVKRTASFGVTTSNESCLAGYQLIDTALVAVNNAKKRGKNKIHTLSPQGNHTLYRDEFCQPS
ncbi:GGDEF domain-containing protein [Enterovibrio makurazakiensis]|uniref:diguanylate cyclase n=1 Tax=Enterovibrio gelatinilyticus TaxID=2899819 RepID=A0ABT5R6Y6_9GAMM|nr:GGDEF domain-containing protein [Enterovibrio sp. ZSDZ42]MDD1795595.1 GGDEF domain-containing protein [Enterovibrio sp. ZSDZ42]